MPPSDTFFSQPAGWHWLVVFYFFFGGLAGGSFLVGALADLFGTREHRGVARAGARLALVALVPCPPLLIADLGRPERFWHLFVQSNKGAPMLKWYSPISIGSWSLAAFGVVVVLAALGSFAEEERGPRWIARFAFARRGRVRPILAGVGACLAAFVAGYTGVLLSVTNRPVWGDTVLLGMLFVTSATAGGAAALGLAPAAQGDAARAYLGRMERRAALLELGVLAVIVVSLGPIARVWIGGWGAVLATSVALGILAPLAAASRPRLHSAAAVWVLAGGLLLRAAIVMSAESVPQADGTRPTAAADAR